MDFFDRQQLARRNTRLLVLYFSLSLLCIIFAVYAVAAIVFRRPSRIPFPEAMARLGEWFWDPQLFLWAGGGTLAVVFIASLFKILELRRGGAAVASALGGRPVNPDTQDPAERRLMNVVEEMAIASGLPAPEVYVLDEERGINAFTAGLYPTDAVVAVTRGCLDLLSRDELQGVVAHEFSHILNGDMRLNLRLIGLLSGILAIAMIGYFLLRVSFGGSRRSSSGGRGKGAPQMALFGLALLVIGWIGVFFGRLIKSAISRQREYLADAAAVQFTRNPGGLAGALKKIGGYVLGSRIGSHAADFLQRAGEAARIAGELD
ncbi:MAG: M48 family metallopeptidase, partial [Verrucomicrobia bacterium]|nr:M48 family metallopeptidase [Verrucomicrobiota bacterium]